MTPRSPLKRPIASFCVMGLLFQALPPGAGDFLLPSSASLMANADAGPWIAEVRVTNNTFNDTDPQIFPNATGVASILWRSHQTTPDSYALAKVNPYGTILQAETEISNHTVASNVSYLPPSPAAGIDSKGNVHIAFEQDPYTIGYQKVSPDGTVIIPAIAVGPNDSKVSESPTLVVARDDSIHIARADYKFQCEDILYDKLSNDGTEVWVSRVVSSDVTTSAQTPFLKANNPTGDLLLSFGSSSGTWMGRMDEFGVKAIPSVKVRTAGDYRPVDLASTPTGEVHVVWVDNGDLHYTLVNASGVKVVDSVILAATTTATGFPRIAAASDGSVFIVWQDTRWGGIQVAYASIRPGMGLGQVKVTALTSSPHWALDPAIAIDSQDHIHVAWSDDRDGNREIYYKRTYDCPVEIYADPIEMGSLFFMHPNETQNTTLHLMNHGNLSLNLTLSQNVSQAAIDRGWAIALSRYFVGNLSGGNSSNFTLSVRAPVDAYDGENISFRISAASGGVHPCSDTIAFSKYVQVTRSLELAVGEPRKHGDRGATVAFNLTAANRGDLRENVLDVLVGGDRAPTGWNATADKSTLALGPGETTNFTVYVEVPVESWLAPGNLEARLAVEIRSAHDPTVSALRELVVIVRPDFGIWIDVDSALLRVRPADTSQVRITVANVGNVLSRTEITVGQQTLLPAGWVATPQPALISLSAGEDGEVVVNVVAPPDALAGTMFDLVFLASSSRSSQNASATVSIVVEESCGFESEHSWPPLAIGGDVASFTVTARNLANFPVVVNLSARNVPQGWTLRFSYRGAALGQLALGPWSETIVDVQMTPALNTWAGSYNITVVFESSGCGFYVETVETRVPPVHRLEIAPIVQPNAGGIGSHVIFEFGVGNRGNLPLNVSVAAAGIPMDFETRLVRLAWDNITEYPHPIAGLFVINPGETHRVRLDLTVANGTAASGVDFSIKARAQGSANVSRLIHLEILRPDLGFSSPHVVPAVPQPRQRTLIELPVRNIGMSASAVATVRFFVDGAWADSKEIAALEVNESITAEFSWIATPGVHTLRFDVKIGSGFREHRTDNNLVDLSISVAVVSEANTFSANVFLITLLAAAGLAGVPFYISLRSRKR